MKSEWEAKSLGYDVFKHTEELYNAYDTRQKIARVQEYIQRTPTNKM